MDGAGNELSSVRDPLLDHSASSARSYRHPAVWSPLGLGSVARVLATRPRRARARIGRATCGWGRDVGAGRWPGWRSPDARAPVPPGGAARFLEGVAAPPILGRAFLYRGCARRNCGRRPILPDTRRTVLALLRRVRSCD